jgi:hypothetical protein
MSEHEYENSLGPTGRPRRAAAPTHGSNGWTDSRRASRRNTSADSDDEGTEAEFGDDEEDAHVPEESEEEEDEFDEDEAMVDDDINDQPQSLMVKLSVTPPKLRTVLSPNTQAVNFMPVAPEEEDSRPQTQEGPLSEMENGAVAQADNATEGTKPAVSGDTMSQATGTVDKNDRPTTSGSVPASAQASVPEDAPLSAIPLAYRGSPEKPNAQLAASTPLSVGKQD